MGHDACRRRRRHIPQNRGNRRRPDQSASVRWPGDNGERTCALIYPTCQLDQRRWASCDFRGAAVDLSCERLSVKNGAEEAGTINCQCCFDGFRRSDWPMDKNPIGDRDEGLLASFWENEFELERIRADLVGVKTHSEKVEQCTCWQIGENNRLRRGPTRRDAVTKLLGTHQVHVVGSTQARQTGGVAVAAAKASFSTATVYLLEGAGPTVPVRKVRERRRPDPLVGIFDAEVCRRSKRRRGSDRSGFSTSRSAAIQTWIQACELPSCASLRRNHDEPDRDIEGFARALCAGDDPRSFDRQHEPGR